MNARAASLCLAVTGIASPSGRPNVAPGPLSPGISAPFAWPAIEDSFLSLDVGRLPGLEANWIALAPALNLSNDGPSSSVTLPGDTHPFLTASTSNCSALLPAEPG